MDCKLKGITVHYELFGEGRPIINIHGWGGDHRHMVSDMEPLFRKRGGWKRIYPDLPGHGRTPGSDWVTNQDEILGVVMDFIDKVIPGQRFVLAGTSAGAYLARGVVHIRSTNIDGLLLDVPLIVADDAKRHLPPPVALVVNPVLVSELAADEAEFFQIAVIQDRKVVDYIRANFSPGSKGGDQAFQAKIRENPANYSFSFDVDALPNPFPAPTLILTGRQDFVAGYRDAWEIMENYPRGTFVVLDRSGHFASAEQQGLFQALTGEWLDRVEEYAGSLKKE